MVDRCKENCIEWLDGDEVAYVTLSQRRFITKLRKVVAAAPEAEIIKENPDGSVLARIPLSCVHISKFSSRGVHGAAKANVERKAGGADA